MDYRLGEWLVSPERNCLESGGEIIRLKPKVMAVLEQLLQADGAVVTRNALFEAVWPRVEVSDATLTQCIVELRRALGDDAQDPRIIETIPRSGFRLIPPVEVVERPGEPDRPPADVPAVQRRGRARTRSRFPVAIPVLVVIAALIIAYFAGMRNGTLAPSLTGKKTIAVLPFVDMSPDHDQEHFADGLTEELINYLSSVPNLLVTGRTSTFMFKGAGRDLREIGEILDVDHILEGSIRRSGNDLRITAQLIDADSGFHLWSETYEQPLADYFEIQDEIAEAVTSAVGIEMGLGQQGNAHGTNSIEAFDLAMQATTGGNYQTREEFLKVVELLRKATEIDPGYAYAWASLAYIFVLHQDFLDDNWRALSGEYIQRAQELAPNSERVLWYVVFYEVSLQHWNEAQKTLDRVVAMDRDAAQIPQMELLLKVGKATEAAVIGERARRRDPLNVGVDIFLQHAYATSGRLDEALEVSERLYQKLPSAATVQEALITAFRYPDPAKRKLWLARTLEIADPGTVHPAMAERLDDPEAALQWLHDHPPVTPEDRYAAIAWSAELGDPEYALELMWDNPDPWIFWMPHNESMRQLPKFREYVEHLGLVDFWRENGWNDFCRPTGDGDGFSCS